MSQRVELDLSGASAFVGHNADYYIEKWTPRPGGDHRFGFNWPAFFFQTTWMAYRRMYVRAIVVTCTLKLISFGLRSLSPEPSSATPDTPWHYLAYLPLMLLFGFMGNRWYFAHTVRRLATLPDSASTARDDATSVAGGVSLTWAVLFSFATYGVTKLLEKLLHIPT